MRKNMIITSLAMMMAMQEQGGKYDREETTDRVKSKKEPKKTIPNGCKEYHFTRSGRFDTTENKWSDIDYIFTCIASNSKNAIKKFEKFSSENKL